MISKDDINIKYKFIHSAALEMVESIHVISDPDHHTHCYDWIKRINLKLTEELKNNIMFFSERFGQWTFVMDLVAELAYPLGTPDDLEIVIMKINRMSDLKFSIFFLGLSTFSPDMKKIQQCIDAPESIDCSFFSGESLPVSHENIQLFFRKLPAIKKLLIKTMYQYWKEIFECEWKSIDNYIRTFIKRGVMLAERNNPVNYICSFHENIYIENDYLIFKKEPGFSIRLTDIREIVITPSVFSYPHLYGNIFKNRVYIALNMNYNAVEVNEDIPVKTIDFMNALSDETRFKMIKLLWKNAMTTTELAEILTLSPSTVSNHLKILKEVNAVKIRKENKYVFYSINKEPFFNIQNELIDSLE